MASARAAARRFSSSVVRVSRRQPDGPLPRARRVGGGRDPRAASADRRHRRGLVDHAGDAPQAAARARRARVRRGLDRAQARRRASRRSRRSTATRSCSCSRARIATDSTPYTWWFPIVGRVPYKGYFDFAGAKRAERAARRSRLRRLSPAVAGVQHARLVQRPAALDFAARRHARPGEHGHSRADAQHVLRVRVSGLQ